MRVAVQQWLLVMLLVVVSLPPVVACGGPLDPCTYCGDGIIQCPNDDGECEHCDGASGCSSGYACWQCSCVQTGCNHDGTCQSPPETAANCPSDCCAPNCAGKECGADGCGGYCPPYFATCPANQVCTAAGSCCTPSCPSPDQVSCGTTNTQNDGCGGSCHVIGASCPDPGAWCSNGICVECSQASHCDDQNECTDDTCSNGNCVNTAVIGRACTTTGGGTGECTAQSSCEPVCATPMADCNDDGSCETNLHTDDNNCGACGTTCSWDQRCDTGTCLCAYNPLSTYCNGECGQHTVCGTSIDCGDCTSCTSDQHCSAGKHCCDAFCVNTQTSTNHCGFCGTTCSDGNECTSDACAGGSCTYNPVTDGTICDDGAASGSGQCVSGLCRDCHNDNGCTPPLVCVNLVCTQTTIYYQDGDNDGYGNPSVSTTSTSGAPQGYVGNPEDCNDNDSGISPGTIERCGNDIDENCDGEAPLICDDCSGQTSGTKCRLPNQSIGHCDEGSCLPTSYTISNLDESYLATAGETLTFSPGITPSANVVITATGYLEGVINPHLGETFIKLVTNTEVGPRTASFTATRVLDGATLAKKSVAFQVLCNPLNPDYGPCCETSGAYEADQSPCTHPNSGPGETWWCQSGRCEEHCSPGEKRCKENQVWQYDTCGNPRALINDCPHLGKICIEDPAARCDDPPTTCNGEYAYECRGHEGVRIDTGCGTVETIATCSPEQECIFDEHGVRCSPRNPCHAQSGTIRCGDQCIDPLSSRTDCGTCNHGCSQDEQCIDGHCTLVPSCTVICDSDEDCGEGYVCVNRGSCTASECQPANLLGQNESEAAFLAERLTNGLVHVEVELHGNSYHFSARNLGPATLENVSITVEVEKSVAATADELDISGIDFAVLELDPILQFTIPHLEDAHEWTMAVTNRDELEASDGIIIRAIEYQEPDLLESWNKTKDALTIGVTSEFDGENTQIQLNLNPNRDMDDVTIPLEIPKCMAAHAAELHLEGNYHIIHEDPLIVWQFDELTQPTSISFSVPKDVDEECKAQLRAMAMARRIGKPLNPWLSLLLIPVIGATLIFFQRFTPATAQQKRMSKEEFFAIGRQQGVDEQNLERDWREYKERFHR